MELCFIDHPSNEMSVGDSSIRNIALSNMNIFHLQVENILTTYDPQACVIVYSIDDRKSFSTACDILHYLSSQQSAHKIAKLLVSNKVDLERSRLVSLQGMR